MAEILGGQKDLSRSVYAVQVDDTPIIIRSFCQIKIHCINNKATEICETCKKCSCGKCIGEKIIQSKCVNCTQND